MKFGVRECCDVVLRAKGAQKVGNKIFYKHEPVIYFDTLKTTSLEGSATTVYAQGGRGNARLMSWDGERTLTWTMEDALISPVGLMILSGAGLIDSPAKDSAEQGIIVHTTEQIQLNSDNFSSVSGSSGYFRIKLSQKPYDPNNGTANQYSGDYIYVMRLDDNGDIASEPFIGTADGEDGWIKIDARMRIDEAGNKWNYDYLKDDGYLARNTKPLALNDVVLVDYYREVKGIGAAQQINITPDKFGGSYYLEASTLFRNEDGIDMPAEFIIPNCRIQSNFTFTMSSSGDPSSFTFTMDCFPDYTRFDRTEKVLAAIQVITENVGAGNELMRLETNHHGVYVHDTIDGTIVDERYVYGAQAGEDGAYTGELEGQLNETYAAYNLSDTKAAEFVNFATEGADAGKPQKVSGQGYAPIADV